MSTTIATLRRHVIPDDKYAARQQLDTAMVAALKRHGEWAIPCSRDPEAWFPEKARDSKYAQLMCLTECPVLAECRALALAEPRERWGVVGGMWMEKRRGAVGKRDCEQCGELYFPGNSSQRYCSRECSWVARRASVQQYDQKRVRR